MNAVLLSLSLLVGQLCLIVGKLLRYFHSWYLKSIYIVLLLTKIFLKVVPNSRKEFCFVCLFRWKSIWAVPKKLLNKFSDQQPLRTDMQKYKYNFKCCQIENFGVVTSKALSCHIKSFKMPDRKLLGCPIKTFCVVNFKTFEFSDTQF